ncbi:MAG: hypothetical protein OXU50_03035 [Gammaproteobacteria bacterium]|nr:hypothetical protein [Gammaproteobacteria bacterium]
MARGIMAGPARAAAVLALLLSAPAPAAAQTTLDLQWQTRYISEARDYIGNGGFFGLKLAHRFDSGAFVGWWHLYGDQTHYIKHNIFAGYGQTRGDFYIEFSWHRLNFWEREGPANGSNDFYLYSSWHGLDWLTPVLHAYYNTRFNGTHIQLNVESPALFKTAYMSVTPYIGVAVDENYSTTDHDGLNHIEAGIKGVIPLSDKTRLKFFFTHTDARADVKKEGLGDKNWAGVHLSFTL